MATSLGLWNSKSHMYEAADRRQLFGPDGYAENIGKFDQRLLTRPLGWVLGTLGPSLHTHTTPRTCSFYSQVWNFNLACPLDRAAERKRFEGMARNRSIGEKRSLSCLLVFYFLTFPVDWNAYPSIKYSREYPMSHRRARYKGVG